jgi:hypothetical protein
MGRYFRVFLCGVVVSLIACGGSDSAVVQVSAYPWPGDAEDGLSAGLEPGADVPLSEIEGAIPDPLPDPIERQTCNSGAIVEIIFENGETVTYGPCNRPGSIERLRIAISDAARRTS